MASFRVAFVQGCPRFGEPERNLAMGLELAATVRADLVVLPELWSSGYVFSSHAEVAALAEDARRGMTARRLHEAARRERRHFIAGFPEVSRGRHYNSALLVGPGGVRAVYRKLHLFEREREWFSPGNLPLEVHRVGPARVGMLICFDWRFPEAARVLALAGAATDSEVLFYLALTFGLEEDPIGAVERAVGFVEATAARHGVEHPVQMTLGFSDGERLWGVRYSSEHSSRSLFVSQDVSALKKLHPDNPRLQQLDDTDHAIVSEPLGDLQGAWLEVPESTALVIEGGAHEQLPFRPTRKG